MKSLYEYILEAHGVVSEVNSWDKTVDFICTHKRSIVTEPEHLAPWMESVSLIQLKSATRERYYAAYRDDLSKMKQDKLAVVVEVDLKNVIFMSSEFKSVLQHELSHAFDDWIHRSKGLGSFFSDKYKLGTGGEFEETNPYNVLNPATATCDDFFALLKYCTYFLEQTEINAYSREFDKWLDSQKVIDLDKLVQLPNDGIGINPLTFVNLLTFALDNESHYILDADHVDWDYILQIIRAPKPGYSKSWSQKFLGKNYPSFRKTMMELYRRAIKDVFMKYRKIIEYHIQEKGLKVSKYPYWWVID